MINLQGSDLQKQLFSLGSLCEAKRGQRVRSSVSSLLSDGQMRSEEVDAPSREHDFGWVKLMS